MSVWRSSGFSIGLAPVLLLRQRMSDTPSPLKSPTPTSFHACSVTPTTACSVERFPDFQIVLLPVLVLRHRMSDTLSPLKSLVHVKSPETGVTVARNVAMIGID